MFLMIENKGICPIEGITKLGVSSHANDSNAVGMFGSGLKHGVLTLLRHGLNPVITLGRNKMTYYVKPAQMGQTTYNSVFAKMTGESNKEIELGFALEYGHRDWNKIDYALREFITNALDQSGVEGTKIDVVLDTRAKSDYTRIFVPMTPEVQLYINNLKHHFLHFGNSNKIGVIKKDKVSPMKIYFKGVFVREENDSLYDYNFDDSLKIDETRTLSSYAINQAIGNMLNNDKEALKGYITAHINQVHCYEVNRIYSWDIDRTKVAAAFKEMYPDGVITTTENNLSFIQAKGRKGLLVKSNFYDMLKEMVDTNETVLSKCEQMGGTIIETSEDTLFTAYSVWEKLEELGLTNGKKFPEVKNFSKVQSHGHLFGYYQNNCIYINIEHKVNIPTILEELAHHITGAADNTREFQEFAFNVASRLMFNSNQ